VAPISGERVEIRLKTGMVVNGIVKGDHYVTLVRARPKKAANRDVHGAGILVWYAYDLNGYFFVPYSTVEKIKFGKKLSFDEGVKIARGIAEEKRLAEKRRVEATAQLEAEKAARKAVEDGTETGEGDAVGKSKSPEGAVVGAKEQDLKIRELLKRFPPTKWKPGRMDEIKRRAIILDVYPNEEEKAFMDNYELWLKGYEYWQKESAKR
jgi:hypothetical protein